MESEIASDREGRGSIKIKVIRGERRESAAVGSFVMRRKTQSILSSSSASRGTRREAQWELHWLLSRGKLILSSYWSSSGNANVLLAVIFLYHKLKW